MRISFLLSIAGAAGALLLAPSARASEIYPAYLAEKYQMACVPQCTLCHTVNPGIAGTSGTPFIFGTATGDMPDPSKRIIVPMSTELLQAKLDERELQLTDVDKDGVHDIQELRQSTDPNVFGAETLCGQTTQFGCGATIARHAEGARAETGAAAIMLGLLGLWSFRRRRFRALE